MNMRDRQTLGVAERVSELAALRVLNRSDPPKSRRGNDVVLRERRCGVCGSDKFVSFGYDGDVIVGACYWGR